MKKQLLVLGITSLMSLNLFAEDSKVTCEGLKNESKIALNKLFESKKGDLIKAARHMVKENKKLTQLTKSMFLNDDGSFGITEDGMFFLARDKDEDFYLQNASKIMSSVEDLIGFNASSNPYNIYINPIQSILFAMSEEHNKEFKEKRLKLPFDYNCFTDIHNSDIDLLNQVIKADGALSTLKSNVYTSASAVLAPYLLESIGLDERDLEIRRLTKELNQLKSSTKTALDSDTAGETNQSSPIQNNKGES